MIKKAHYWLARISAIVISYTVYLFLTESMTYITTSRQVFAFFMGCSLTVIILATWLIIKRPFKFLPKLPNIKILQTIPSELQNQLGAYSGYSKMILGADFKKMKQDANIILAFSPLGLWFGMFWYFLMGGFVKDINIVGFLFLSVVTGIPLMINIYAWINPKNGGALYILLGIFYTLLSAGRISPVAIITITALLVQTGTLFILEKREPVITPPPTAPMG